MRAPRTARSALCLLCASAALIGLTATIAPRAFYNDFPFIAHWVNLLPPYNEHLVTDVGGLYLGFAVVFGWAALALELSLLRAACLGWLFTAALHFVFHAGHLEGFSTADAVAELASLALLIGAPLLALWASADASIGSSSGSPKSPRP